MWVEVDGCSSDRPGGQALGTDMLGTGVPGTGALGMSVPGMGALGTGVPETGVVRTGQLGRHCAGRKLRSSRSPLRWAFAAVLTPARSAPPASPLAPPRTPATPPGRPLAPTHKSPCPHPTSRTRRRAPLCCPSSAACRLLRCVPHRHAPPQHWPAPGNLPRTCESPGHTPAGATTPPTTPTAHTHAGTSSGNQHPATRRGTHPRTNPRKQTREKERCPKMRKGHPTRDGPTTYQRLSGGVLLSHTVPGAVPSALTGLTSGFGM